MFIGEGNLDITNAVGSSTKIGLWSSVPSGTSPIKTVDVSQTQTSFLVNPTDFVGYTGTWYRLNPADQISPQGVAFIVADPTLSIRVWNLENNIDFTGKSLVHGDHLGFRVDTNMYAAVDPQYRPNVNAATDGYINIEVRGPFDWDTFSPGNWETYGVPSQVRQSTPRTSLYNSGGTITPLTNQFDTGALDQNGQYRYPTGGYIVWAETTLNKMNDNYRQNNGEGYIGKTVSAYGTVTIVSDVVNIEANKETVVSNQPFSIYINGKPNSEYYVWITGTSAMSGGYGNEAPMIVLNQPGVYMDTPSDP
ncbi:MAG: DUF3821 domain-containing protein, partial [Methanoregula sp.]|nr:DUF3821 domain-containing protein [Methanoregula sp.]